MDDRHKEQEIFFYSPNSVSHIGQFCVVSNLSFSSLEQLILCVSKDNGLSVYANQNLDEGLEAIMSFFKENCFCPRL